MAIDFDKTLKYGKSGESLIARWFMSRGYNVLPAYEKTIRDHKGPQLYLADGEAVITPDLFVFNAEHGFWIEAKHKSAFALFRNLDKWTTGVDLRHYEDYCKVADSTPWPVWLLFLHEKGTAKDSPPGCPTGLFGNDLSVLRTCEAMRSDVTHMVYWTSDSLIKMAYLSTLYALREMAA